MKKILIDPYQPKKEYKIIFKFGSPTVLGVMHDYKVNQYMGPEKAPHIIFWYRNLTLGTFPVICLFKGCRALFVLSLCSPSREGRFG